MSLKAGIVGLPNVGKSTLFNAITKQNILAANYPFATIEPNVGVVAVPDNRLDVLSEMYNPEKYTPAVVEFVDIAGLVKGKWGMYTACILRAIIRSFQPGKKRSVCGNAPSPGRLILGLSPMNRES